MKHWKWVLMWLVGLTLAFVPARVSGSGADTEETPLPYRYAWVGLRDVAVYADAGDPSQMQAVRYLQAYNTWVSIKQEIQVGEIRWYRIGEREYVLAGDVWVGTPSTFSGVHIGRGQRAPLAFVLGDVSVHPTADATADVLYTLHRYAAVNVRGYRIVDDALWYRMGRDQYIAGEHVRLMTRDQRPEGVAPGEKWIAVNLAAQTLAAYEGDRMVFATLVSTGLPWWQTPEGLFQIQTKVRTGSMSRSAPEGGYYYYLQDVPWAMYFTGPYGLHAAYWHDGFGHPRSRGCVNLSPGDAHWLFGWATPAMRDEQQVVSSTEGNRGTWVYVHNTMPTLTESRMWPQLWPPARRSTWTSVQ